MIIFTLRKNVNYFKNIKLYNLLNSNKSNILLFTHMNNFTMLESLKINLYCKNENISNIFIKNSLIKKLIKDAFILNLFKGPSRIFFFVNIIQFLNFFENVLIKKKIIPLLVYWDNYFFSYNIFYNFFNEKKKEISLIKKLNIIINIIVSIRKTIFFILNDFNHFLKLVFIIKKIK